jgi:fucose 4-O-acetylase-like acetyltransferase
MLEAIPNRSGAIDLVRIIAVAAIVAGHVFTRDLTGDLLYTWHVAVFFVLSGYLWKPGRSFRTELGRRWRSLGRPYLAGFVLLTIALLSMGFPDTLQRLLGGLYGGGVAGMPYITLWFISTLFFTALLLRLIERLPLALQWMLGIAGAVAGWIWGSALSDTPLGVGMAATSLIYLLVGDALRRVRDRVRAPALTGLLLIATGAALVASGLSDFIDIKQGDYGTPALSLIASAAISTGLILLAEGVVRPGRFSQVCTLLALPLLTFVLLHPVFLWTPWPAGPTFAAAMLVPLVIGLVALRTPLSPWLTGQARLRRPQADPAR